MMEGNRNLLSNLSSAIGEYLSLRTDDFKKNIVQGLSVGFSRVLAILVITILLLIVLSIFAVAFVVLIGEAIGSISVAAFIVGGTYLICALVIFLLRKRLFQTMFTNLFSSIVFTESHDDDWKRLLLIVVRNLRNGISGEN